MSYISNINQLYEHSQSCDHFLSNLVFFYEFDPRFIALDTMYLVRDLICFFFVSPEGWSLSKVFSSSLPLFISLSQFEWRGLRVTNFSFAVPEPHLHRSTCSLTCLYLRASARSKRIPTNEAYIICRGPHDRARVFLKMGPSMELNTYITDGYTSRHLK